VLPTKVPRMNIEEFYDADERRRQSSEVELGTEWRDKDGVRYELNWIVDTGEVYVMREPLAGIAVDLFGDLYLEGGNHPSAKGMTVAVIGHFGTQEELDRVFSGWEDEMPAPDSAHWIAERLRAARAATPSDDAPD
jgi:hypothetical protein